MSQTGSELCRTTRFEASIVGILAIHQHVGLHVHGWANLDKGSLWSSVGPFVRLMPKSSFTYCYFPIWISFQFPFEIAVKNDWTLFANISN